MPKTNFIARTLPAKLLRVKMEQAPKSIESTKPKSRTMVLAAIIVVILVVVGVGVYILYRPSTPPPTGTPVTIWDNGPCSNDTTCGFKNNTGGSTLTVPTGTTVLWTNTGSLSHTVTACLSTNPGYSDPGACPNGPNSNTSVNFDSGTSGMIHGATFAFTFNAAGTYDYYCYFHPWMHGVIIVQ